MRLKPIQRSEEIKFSLFFFERSFIKSRRERDNFRLQI